MSGASQLFKAIETKYHGYRFRSRLEARWAVFFDTLTLDYRYEPEGYALEGVAYLPDFYLPQHNCFLEIKGQQPTPEEMEKTRLLALYTGKEVYIQFGDIWLPNEPASYTVYRYTPPRIYAYPQGKSLEGSPREVVVHQDVIILLQKLSDLNISIDVQYGLVRLHATHAFSCQIFTMQHYLLSLQKQYEEISQLAPLLEKYTHDIIDVLTPREGWGCVFQRQILSWGLAWAECSACGNISLIANAENVGSEQPLTHRQCIQKTQGTYCYDSPRLRTAYVAARQARF